MQNVINEAISYAVMAYRLSKDDIDMDHVYMVPDYDAVQISLKNGDKLTVSGRNVYVYLQKFRENVKASNNYE